MAEKSLWVFFKHLLELQNRGLRYSVNMNPYKKKMCWKVLFVSRSGDVPDSCEREISMNVSVSHPWNKSTDSVKWGGGLGVGGVLEMVLF